jgi:hypothetical protein
MQDWLFSGPKSSFLIVDRSHLVKSRISSLSGCATIQDWLLIQQRVMHKRGERLHRRHTSYYGGNQRHPRLPNEYPLLFRLTAAFCQIEYIPSRYAVLLRGMKMMLRVPMIAMCL